MTAASFPAKVDRVLDRGVVAEAAHRREQVGGVAGEEQPALPEPLGDQGEAGGPGGAEQDVETDLPAHAIGEHAAGCRRR